MADPPAAGFNRELDIKTNDKKLEETMLTELNQDNFFFHLYKCGKIFHLYRFRINEIISAKILKSRIKFL